MSTDAKAADAVVSPLLAKLSKPCFSTHDIAPSQRMSPELELVLDQGGELGRLIRERDWSATPVGPMKSWPPALVTALGIMLASNFPMVIFWGPSFTCFYNDGYIPMFGKRHPRGLGAPAREAWSEIWDVIHPMFLQVLSGKATMSTDQILLLTRNGYSEECYFTWSYSPVRNPLGQVEGVITPVFETTQRVLQERRMTLLHDLGSKTLDAHSVSRACDAISGVLASQPTLIPFSLLYLADQSTGELRLRGCSGVPAGSADQPSSAASSPALLRFLEARMTESNGASCVVDTSAFESLIRDIPRTEEWIFPLEKVLLLPFRPSHSIGHCHLLVLGVNPRRDLDDCYRGFLTLVSQQIARAIQTATNHEEEKMRLEQLAQLDRAKTEFFSNVSHEFRTPLTLMIGPLEDSLSDPVHPLTDDQRQRQQLIYQNALRLLKHVNALLDFSRIQSNRINACFEPTNLEDLTNNLTAVFRAVIEKAGLSLGVQMQLSRDPTVYIDREMYEKIIFNLLSNAFKFTFSGGITVQLREGEGNSVELRVKDTGVGIPASELPRVFERFHRVANSKGRSFEGTGIGLALTSELVRVHGGSIRVESDTTGTTFTLNFLRGFCHLPSQHVRPHESYLMGSIGQSFLEEASHWLPASPPVLFPQHELSPGPESDNWLLPAAAVSHSQERPRARLLVADDNRDMLNYLTLLLADEGDVEGVHDGVAALKAARHNPPDLIVTDVMMPHMNGFELISHLKRHDNTRDIPIIMLSARAGDEARVEGLHAGADDYLVKPFSAKELVARVQVHLELCRLRKHLEHQVRLRTAQLQEANVALQREATERLRTETELTAQRARAEVSEQYNCKQEHFIDALCHEIRNPLNGVYGTVILMRDKLQELIEHQRQQESGCANASCAPLVLQELQQDLSTLACCTEQQKVILDDVLDLSKLNNQKIELNETECNVYEVLGRSAKQFASLLQQKRLGLRLDCPSPLWCTLDSHRVSQVLINLLSNAIKFTQTGGVTVRVRHSAEGTLGGVLTIAVEDTGVGMTEEEMSRLFDRFYQANVRVSSTYGGSGLGLSLSKQLALLMQGDLTVESKKGVGSTFTFSFPCQRTTGHSDLPPGGRAALYPPSLPKLPSRKVVILIVEDNLINQKLLMNLLSKKGFFYEVADNGQEAVNKFLTCGRIDLVFMDVQMPVMDGLEATRRIRDLERETHPHVPIIALTGNARDARLQDALAAGMDGYLTKPYDWQRIYDMIVHFVPDI